MKDWGWPVRFVVVGAGFGLWALEATVAHHAATSRLLVLLAGFFGFAGLMLALLWGWRQSDAQRVRASGRWWLLTRAGSRYTCGLSAALLLILGGVTVADCLQGADFTTLLPRVVVWGLIFHNLRQAQARLRR